MDVWLVLEPDVISFGRKCIGMHANYVMIHCEMVFSWCDVHESREKDMNCLPVSVGLFFSTRAFFFFFLSFFLRELCVVFFSRSLFFFFHSGYFRDR